MARAHYDWRVAGIGAGMALAALLCGCKPPAPPPPAAGNNTAAPVTAAPTRPAADAALDSRPAPTSPRAINPSASAEPPLSDAEIAAQQFVGAANDNDLALVGKMLDAGHDPNDKGGTEYTALHRAARSGNIEMCKLLVEHGAKVNATTDLGMTPFHWAARSGHIPVLEYLLSQGADINAVGRFPSKDDADPDAVTEVTAIDLAAALQRQDVVDWLKAHGAK